MKVQSSFVIKAPKADVWKALQDPAVLARTLPGCEALEVVGPDRYAMTISAGVASIKGTYQGTVELADKVEPDTMRMKAQGAGAPGTIFADAQVRLEAVEGGTRVEYDADAIVGGMIGGVGQRVLVGVTKKTAGEFFKAVEGELLHGPTTAPEVPGDAAAVAAAVTAAGQVPEIGQVFSPAGTAPTSAGQPDALKLLAAALIGAAVALVGVLIGRSTR